MHDRKDDIEDDDDDDYDEDNDEDNDVDDNYYDGNAFAAAAYDVVGDRVEDESDSYPHSSQSLS